MTSLHAATTGILQAAPGAWACCIMGFDGLTVEAQEAPACPADMLSWVTAVSAPLAALQRACRPPGGGADSALAGGGWQTLTIGSGGCHLVVHELGPHHFAALVMGPEGLSGQGRYVLRQHRPRLMTALFPPDAGGPDPALPGPP